ncbi:MAG: Thiol-disulfide oxidoreductase ResA [Methanoregulaceae archaeon PtaB.Bin009]|nr:MAG: Thiol-disulfide oxidoreductase ResA [Methanoregulaceae archaeon PtaB.Bin009]OPY42084.1 MAG: Thiol-disulfide oxidoreductase ResA [Methanoregulaceae archaeon PtaU1.Bin066]HNQ29028.1 cytochrome c biogenesis protein CcdA [Methanolinea sp.]
MGTTRPEVRKKRLSNLCKLVISLIFVTLFLANAWADSPGPAPEGGEKRESPIPSTLLYEDGKPVVHFFYNTYCTECQKTVPYMQEIAPLYPGVVFRFHDIRESDEARILFQEFKQQYGREFLPVPSLFLGPYVLSGYEEITANLGDAIRLTMMQGEVRPTIPVPEVTGTKEVLTIPLVVGAALVDGINPCAFAVLIFLVLSLIALDTRKRVVTVGATFILAVFCFYFLSGLGLFAIVQSSGMSLLISVAAAAIAILAGVISIGEALWKRKTPFLSIPESTRGIIDTWAKKGSVPGAFVLGVLVGMFELPCTGGIYLAILSLLSNRMTMYEGIPYLLLYNLIFVFPLVLILAVVALGIAPEKLEKLREEKRPIIRLAMGGVMILLGIVLILEII